MDVRRGTVAVWLGAIMLVGWGCSASGDPASFSSGGSPGAGGEHGTGGSFGGAFGEGGTVQGALEIKPADPVLKYTGTPVTQAFEAFSYGNKVDVAWSLDNIALGTIDATGLFTASGATGGVAKVTAQLGDVTGSTTVTVQLELTENPGNVSTGDIAKLKAGGNADSGFRWLYPYDKTVFPRGLAAPTVQLGGTAPSAVWVHAETPSKTIVYDGFFGPSNPARVDMSPTTWGALTHSVGPNESLKVEVTKLSNGQASGPLTQTWSVAQGTLKGTVYYNSYDSQLANGIGAVLRLKPGQNASILAGGGGKCTVCHTVSANGNVLLASNNDYQTGAKYDLLNNGAMSTPRIDYAYNFPAVYPDGSIALSTSGQHIGGMWGFDTSKLYDVNTGQTIPAPGFDGVVLHAGMPAFSPDGKKLAFNWEDQNDMHSLAVMDFAVQNKTFSNLDIVAQDPSHALGWPSFLPDGKSVLFDVNDGADYGTWFNYRSDLSIVDLATKVVTKLDRLNGYEGGQLYLPFGPDDATRNFEPNVLPVAVGGYYWVIFTSRRQYGNTIDTVETGDYGMTTRKKLWIAAIDINAMPGVDPSHPPIYLPGQELASGNMRGFWVLDPCKKDGESCESGDECCGGFCHQVTGADGGVTGQCSPMSSGCAEEFEKCTATGDCCEAAQGYLCINGHCAFPPPN